MSFVTLEFPIKTEPHTGDGSAVAIASGVWWLRMPLAPGLQWINVWALEDADGWTLVDTGVHSESTCTAWSMAHAGVMAGKPVRRVIATHMHPDHCGVAGWLVERLSTSLWMTRLEYLSCCLRAREAERGAPADALRFYRTAGLEESAIERYKAGFGYTNSMLYPMPASFHRLSDGDQIRIGNHDWQILIGSGHSPEHASLYCAALKLLISGDQVLPKISSFVSVSPIEPEANPLGDWLNSLKKIASSVPEDVLVLPAHNSPFRGLHTRIQELIDGHEASLARVWQRIAEPCRVVDLFQCLFARHPSPAKLTMATGETLAYLHVLRARGRAIRQLDSNGVAWWKSP